MLEPLRTREQARSAVDADEAAWRAMVERPIGAAIAGALGNDLVRGVVATDALIGTFARLDDPSLQQNVCFLYHLLGGGDGGWHVPVGGMGAVSAALAGAAKGAEIVTGAEVYAIDPGGEVRYRHGDVEHVVRARFVLSGVTPTTLAGLLGEPAPASAPGAQVKVNLMLRATAAAARPERHTRAGFRRHIPRQRNLDPTGRRLRPGRSNALCRIRCHARSTAIR